MKLLLVEDNRQLAEQLADTLAEHHYVVDVARDGEEGWELAQLVPYDLLVLDVSLPRLDGVSLCRRLRSRGSQTPILMLTAHNSCADKVMGLDAGADDYLAKPIVLNELTARLRALLRRNVRELTPILAKGKLQLDPVAMQVTYDGAPVKLSPKEYLLLELFLRNSQRIYSRKAIMDQLWGLDADLPGEDTVKAHIKGLRNRLKLFGVQDLIQSVYGVGYRLNPDYKDQVTADSPIALAQTPGAPRVLTLGNCLQGDPILLQHWQLQALPTDPAAWQRSMEAGLPDLIAMDLAMPESLKLCQMLREHAQWSDLPIAGFYPAGEMQYLQQGLAMGVDDCLENNLPIQQVMLQLEGRLNRIRQLKARWQMTATQPSTQSSKPHCAA
ncbi:MAG: response regulator [Alkalinema sp. RU_4_3]|nr:response regulator [Alkalinema sp. RU_4_3]